MDPKNLASRVCYLPIFVVDRVKLWLTYKGLKTASLITINSKSYLSTQAKIKRIEKWIKDANLYFQFDLLNPNKNNLIVSKNQKTIENLNKTKLPLSDKDHYQSGIMFGYPPKAAKTFAYGQRPQLADPTGKDSPIKNWPESLYAQFFVRKGHEKEDIKVAKKWMDTIQKDIPKLAKWYEKEVANIVEN